MSMAVLQNRGRPPKQNVIRDKAGKSRGEAMDSIMAVALLPRLREGITYEQAVIRDQRTGKVVRSNPDAGHVLGKLKMWGASTGISETQFFTGMEYAELIRDYQRIVGIPSDAVRSPGFEIVSRGEGTGLGPSAKTVSRIKTNFCDCYDALVSCGYVFEGEKHGGAEIAKITYDACLDLCDISSIKSRESGYIRVGLNALARVLR